MANISDILGKTLAEVRRDGDDRIYFSTTDGESFVMHHSQDCCEQVSIEDVAGDLNDLVGSPITKAEEVVHDNQTPDGTPERRDNDSYTWTFYHLATVKGYVTIRWYGSSNGYYSESVNFDKV